MNKIYWPFIAPPDDKASQPNNILDSCGRKSKIGQAKVNMANIFVEDMQVIGP